MKKKLKTHSKGIRKNEIIFLSQKKKYSFEDEWFNESMNNNFWMKWRLNSFLQSINKLSILKKQKLEILDIGCGTGVLMKQLKKETNWNVSGADIDIKALENNLVKNQNLYYYDINEEKKMLVEKFDVIFLFDVIEHIKNPKKFLDSAIKHLKPNGYLFINVPALNIFYSAYDEAVGHHRRYNKKTLLNELKHSSLNVIKIKYWGILLLPFLIIRRFILGKNLKSVDDKNRVIKRGWRPSKFLSLIMVTLMKIENSVLKKQIVGTSILCYCQKN